MEKNNNRPTIVMDLDPPKAPVTIGDLMADANKYLGACFLLKGSAGTHLVQFVRIQASTYRILCLENGDRWCDYPDANDSTPLTPVDVTMTVESVE